MAPSTLKCVRGEEDQWIEKNSKLVCILKNPLWFASRVVEHVWRKDGCLVFRHLSPKYHFYAAFTATALVLFTFWYLMMQPPQKAQIICIFGKLFACVAVPKIHPHLPMDNVRGGSMNRQSSELVCVSKNPLWFSSRVVRCAWRKDGCAYFRILASSPKPQYHFYAAFTTTAVVLFTFWNLMMQPPRKQIAISIKIFERSCKIFEEAILWVCYDPGVEVAYRLFLCVLRETRFARKWRNSIFYYETLFFPPKTRIYIF